MKRTAILFTAAVGVTGDLVFRVPEARAERSMVENLSDSIAAIPLTSVALAFLLALAIGLAAMQFIYRGRINGLQAELDSLSNQIDGRDTALQSPQVGLIGLVASDSSGEGSVLRHVSPPVASLLRTDAGSLNSIDAIAALLSDGSGSRLVTAVSRLMAEGKAFSFESGIRNGARIVRISGIPIDAGSGAIGRATVSIVDISELAGARSAAEDEARKWRRKTEDLLAAVNLQTIPFWQRDEDMRIRFANIAADVIDLDSEPARDTSRRARRLGAPFSESRFIVVDGERRLFEVTEAPGTAGRGTVGWAIDVTALEEAQAEIARHIAAHEDVLEGLSTAIAIFGPDKRLKFFNSAFANLWEVDPAKLDADPTITEFLELLRELRRLPEQSDFRAYRDHWNGLFTRLIDPLEDFFFLPDDRTLRMVVMPHPFGGLFLTFEDVTDRLALERSYNTLNEVQRETIDNLAEGVVVFGADGRMTLSNPTFLKMWDLDSNFHEQSLHVSDVLEAMRPLFPVVEEAVWEDYKQEFAARFADRSAEHGRTERPDGTALEYSFVPLPDGATLVNFLDVTDTLNVQRALQDRNEALETADRLKSEFIANVSYELRTPLNAIIGFAEMLDGGYVGTVSERQSEYLKAILESSGRLSSLIGNIIDLASIEAGYLTLDPKELDVREVVSAAVSLVDERARSQNVTVGVEFEDGVDTIEADDRRLRQILFNLVSSALQFTEAETQITLRVCADADHVDFVILEGGKGVPEEMRTMLFEVFSGVERGGRAQGPDLALPLVRRLVELHGGALSLEPVGGEGLCIKCRMPRHAELPEANPTFANELSL
ncbi:MAG: PAS-domain containing protein [Nisaea sp.]|uniref:PAS domain-containing sensor histidine kinase n=1 Tax=Nisaea sp. TaxID=2024842 RepID=UPI001B1F6B58|nr:PAS domain-containing sensor histidine kinase [Nisaea sp.]MBO6559413.1 PAS-domain containing protein [Nisaea sp.]